MCLYCENVENELAESVDTITRECGVSAKASREEDGIFVLNETSLLLGGGIVDVQAHIH